MDVIIGAGITGLSYARFLPNEDYLILEKENSIGGYCKTTIRNGFIWDYSGHFFHFQSPDIKDLILSEVSADELVSVIKQTKIKYKDSLINYPFQKNIHELPKEELIDCLYDLFTIDQEEFHTFLEMLYCKFGRSITEKFLKPYNEKLYACDLDSLDKDAMGRFFPYAEKEEIIRNFKSDYNSSYNGTFLYPKCGAFTYVQAINKYLDPSKIRLNCDIELISINEHKIQLTSGEIIHFDRLISTIPFPNLLKILGIQYNSEIYNWNQVLVFNLGFDKKGFDQVNHWLYFPEKKYCFYRVGFYDNILQQDRMSLYVEIGFSKDKTINPHEWIGPVLRDLKLAGIISDTHSLIDYESIIMNPAYVHINQDSIKDVREKKMLLKQYDVFSIGRYGSWTYCSIEDNIKEAKKLAEHNGK